MCDLCQRLGAGGYYHKREYCFIDPGSKAYKPDVRAKRICEAQKRGIIVPRDILEMAPLPAPSHNMAGYISDLPTVLDIHGGCSGY